MMHTLQKIYKFKYPIILFASFVSVALLCKYTFFLDEADNILGALAISRGGVIYKDYFSHHTPFMFYLMAPWAWIGLSSVEGLRVAYSFVLFCIWVFGFYRYKKYVGSLSLCLYPVIYALSAPANSGHMILGDSIQAMSMLIILLEIFRYSTVKKISISSAFVFSLCIFAAISTALLSVYPLLFILLIPICYELKKYFAKNADHKKLIGNHAVIALILVLPFVVFLVYLLFNHSLKEAVFQIYTFNRKIYSNYIPTGFGSSAIEPFVDVITNITVYLNSFIEPKIVFIQLLKTVLVTMGLYAVYKKFELNALSLLCIILFIVYSSIRGFTDFHGLPFLTLTSFFYCFSIQDLLDNEGLFSLHAHNKGRLLAWVSICLIVLSGLPSFLPAIKSSVKSIVSNEPVAPMEELESIILSVTDESDPIWVANVQRTALYINTNRPLASRSFALLPWYADAFTDDLLIDLKNNAPKLIYFYEYEDVWGHLYKDFAKTTFEYIRENYTRLPQFHEVYIRNDYYSIAANMLVENDIIKGSKELFYVDNTEVSALPPIYNDYVYSQVFSPYCEGDITSVCAFMGTYTRTNNSNLELSLSDNVTGEILFSDIVDASLFNDNEFFSFAIPSVHVVADRDYKISFKGQGVKSENFVTIYRASNANTRNHAIINGEPQDFNLLVEIYGN